MTPQSSVCQTCNTDYFEIRADYIDSDEMTFTYNYMEHLQLPVADAYKVFFVHAMKAYRGV
jgi:hypothetical protein